MSIKQSISQPTAISLALATVATATLAQSASAATFNLSYTSSAGTITATIDGTLQPDNNTVLVSSISNPTFNGSPAPALPFLGSGNSFTLGQPAILSLNGSGLDFLSCTTTACIDGFAFAPAGVGFASGPSYGGIAGGQPFVLANYSLTPAGVPEPSAVIGLAVMGGGFLWGKRKKSA